MPSIHRIARTAFAVLLAALAIAPVVRAQDYPAKPIRLIVPFPPGGSTDVVGRLMAQHLTERLGQSVIVDNRPGAGSQIGIDAASKAAPDGYTLLFGPADGLAILPAVKPQLPYDALKDFTPIARVATTPFVFTVNAKIPVRSLGELVSHTKANPGAVKYGTPGVGSIAHLAGELLAAKTGARLLHVPYKGGGPAVADFVGGQIEMIIGAPRLVSRHAESGLARMLAQTGSARHPAVPNVPTAAEAGVPDLVVESWFGILGPANLPEPIVARLLQQIRAIVEMPAMRQRLLDASADAAFLPPAAFAEFMAQDLRRWSDVAKTTNIKLQD